MIQQCYRRDLNHSKVIKSCAKSSSNANIEGPAVAKRIKQRLSDHDQKVQFLTRYQSLHPPNFYSIYHSQRQNLLPTLKILTHNFQNFQKIQNFRKKIQNLEFFFQNFQNHKGAANDIKGAAASLLVNSKVSIFN